MHFSQSGEVSYCTNCTHILRYLIIKTTVLKTSGYTYTPMTWPSIQMALHASCQKFELYPDGRKCSLNKISDPQNICMLDDIFIGKPYQGENAIC